MSFAVSRDFIDRSLALHLPHNSCVGSLSRRARARDCAARCSGVTFRAADSADSANRAVIALRVAALSLARLRLSFFCSASLGI